MILNTASLFMFPNRPIITGSAECISKIASQSDQLQRPVHHQIFENIVTNRTGVARHFYCHKCGTY